MLTWLKNLFSTKRIIAFAINELDLIEPILASQIDNAKNSFNALDSKAKAKWIVDQVQDFLRNRFKISVS